MGLFFLYSIKMAICLAVFYLFYMVLLSHETFHRFNRVVVLSVVGLSIVIPFIRVETTRQTAVAEGMMAIEDFVMDGSLNGEAAGSGLSVLQILFFVYIVGVVFFLVKDCVSILKLRKMLGRGRVVWLENGVRLVVMDSNVAPFSWFRNIVISEKDYRDNPLDIITHEKAHVERWHSVDILACNLLITFQWYNPAAWLLKRELQSIHEYEADEAVINQGIDAEHYQLLLIRKAVGERSFSLANNMNHNSLKKRIAMMKKEKSNPWSRMKAVVTIPVSAVAVVAFASPKAQTMANAIEMETGNVVMKVVEQGSSAADTVRKASMETVEVTGVIDASETMPQFPGGAVKMMSFLAENIKYPENAKNNGVEGRVIVTFVIDKEGNVKSPEVVHSIDPELDAEAVRVVSTMPKWTPGTQDGKPVDAKYTIPITFNINGGKEKPLQEKAEMAKNPLIYVDGKKLTYDELKNIAPNTIEKMDVIKDESAVQMYGEEARNGAIIITLKK